MALANTVRFQIQINNIANINPELADTLRVGLEAIDTANTGTIAEKMRFELTITPIIDQTIQLAQTMANDPNPNRINLDRSAAINSILLSVMFKNLGAASIELNNIAALYQANYRPDQEDEANNSPAL